MMMENNNLILEFQKMIDDQTIRLNERLNKMGAAFMDLKASITPSDRKYFVPQMSSDQTNELAAAFAKARAEIKAIKANTPGHYGAYASLEDILPVTDPILSKYGLSVQQDPFFNEYGEDVLITEMMHTSGQWKRSYWLLRTEHLERNKRGGDLTYWKRYCYNAMVGISATDDDPDYKPIKK